VFVKGKAYLLGKAFGLSVLKVEEASLKHCLMLLLSFNVWAKKDKNPTTASVLLQR